MEQTATTGAFMILPLLLGLGIHVYFSLALTTIANKTGTPNAWIAWVPIINIFLMLAVGKKPGWWIILFLVPLLNIIIAVVVWMAIAEARNKPSWMGVLILVPLVNVALPAILAWTD